MGAEPTGREALFKGLQPIVYGGREVWPLVEGGKGVSATNHASSGAWAAAGGIDRKSTRLNSSHSQISYAVFCLKKKKKNNQPSYQLYSPSTVSYFIVKMPV